MIIPNSPGISMKQLKGNVGIRNIQKGSIDDKLTYTTSDKGDYHKIYTFDNYEVLLNGFINPDKMVYLIQPYAFGESSIITGNVTYAYSPRFDSHSTAVSIRIPISNIELKKIRWCFTLNQLMDT